MYHDASVTGEPYHGKENSFHSPSPAGEDPAVFVVGAGEGRGEGLNSKAFKILFLL